MRVRVNDVTLGACHSTQPLWLTPRNYRSLITNPHGLLGAPIPLSFRPPHHPKPAPLSATLTPCPVSPPRVTITTRISIPKPSTPPLSAPLPFLFSSFSIPHRFVLFLFRSTEENRPSIYPLSPTTPPAPPLVPPLAFSRYLSSAPVRLINSHLINRLNRAAFSSGE